MGFLVVMPLLTLGAVAFAVLLLRMAYRPPGRQTHAALPYVATDWLLTPTERGFYYALRQAAGVEFVIFCKVRLADIIHVRPGPGFWQAMRPICMKHLDFVLCDPMTMRPVLAIELDDPSHERPDRAERDRFVEAALAAAQFPLIRFPASNTYNTQVIHNRLFYDGGRAAA